MHCIIQSRINLFGIVMDIEYTWILCQGKNCRLCKFITRKSFISHLVSRMEGMGYRGLWGWTCRYFS